MDVIEFITSKSQTMAYVRNSDIHENRVRFLIKDSTKFKCRKYSYSSDYLDNEVKKEIAKEYSQNQYESLINEYKNGCIETMNEQLFRITELELHISDYIQTKTHFSKSKHPKKVINVVNFLCKGTIVGCLDNDFLSTYNDYLLMIKKAEHARCEYHSKILHLIKVFNKQ